MSDMDELRRLKHSMQNQSGNNSNILIGKWINSEAFGDQKVEFYSNGMVDFDGRYDYSFKCSYQVIGNRIILDGQKDNWELIEHDIGLIELRWESAPMGVFYRKVTSYKQDATEEEIRQKQEILNTQRQYRERVARFQNRIAGIDGWYYFVRDNGTIASICLGYQYWYGIAGNYSDDKWQDTVAITTDGSETLYSMKSDGTIINDDEGEWGESEFDKWRDTVGTTSNIDLKSDGSFYNLHDTVTFNYGYGKYTISFLLKEDGTVTMEQAKQLGWDANTISEVNSWRDIVALSYSELFNRLFALKADGTIVTTASDYKDELCKWQGIVAIFAGSTFFIGLKSDYTLVVANPTCLEKVTSYITEADFMKAEQARRWKEQSLCHHCGGQIGGVFTKKCKQCGKSV